MSQFNEPMTPLKAFLFDTIRTKLTGYDFVYLKADDMFIRRREGVTDQFQLAFKDASPGYRIQPNVGIRIEAVETIFHQASGFEKQYQGQTSTWGAPVGALLGGSARTCEFLLQSQPEVDPVSDRIMDVFRETALPFFERWALLSALDAALNNSPTERVIQRSVAFFRCSTAIIVARLVGRPDYDRLVQIYTGIMKDDNKGFYFKKFAALLEVLEKIPPGGGLAA